jgi:uncharacterized protein VirK/YbjX
VRGVAYGCYHKDWFQILQQPELAVVARHHPYLFQKLQRPYLNCTLNTCQRLEMLKQHYHFVATCLYPAVQQEIYATPGKILATLPVPEAGNYGLRLSCCRQEKEGDLMIGLVNQDTGAVLFTLAFSITQFENENREIFIGGLQGYKQVIEKELIITMTRSWHGLRPKALLLFALQSLAAAWDVRRLRAVSDAKHIYQHWRKRRDLAASYDEFWLESGGQLAADGMFDLPFEFIPREISTLKVNKRQMYKRRYRLLAEIAGQVQISGFIRVQDYRRSGHLDSVSAFVAPALCQGLITR